MKAKEIIELIEGYKPKVGDKVVILKSYFDKDYHGMTGKISDIETDSESVDIDLDDDEETISAYLDDIKKK